MACAQALEQDAPEEIPGDQLVAWLVRELLHAAVEGLGAAPLLAYGAGLPRTWRATGPACSWSARTAPS